MTTPSNVATPAKTPFSDEGYERLKEGARKGGHAVSLATLPTLRG